MSTVNVIFRGPTEKQPQTVSDKLVAGAYLPGTFVEESATEFDQLTTALNKLPLLLTNRDFYGQDITTAYADEDTGVAYKLEPGLMFQARLAAATYALNDPLTIAAAGRLAAATGGTTVVAFFTGVPGTFAAGALADVTIANSYIKPAV